MTHLLAIAVFCLQPMSPVVHDRCEVIERNSFYDGDGRLVFVQFVGWHTYDSGYHVGWWRLDKGQFQLKRDYDNREWALKWMDDGVLREVRARTFDESFTQFDVELADRDLLPVPQRRPLKQSERK